MLSSSLLVIHDARRGGQDDIPELTGWKQSHNPLLKIFQLDIVSWRDNTGFVEAAVQLNDDLAVAMVVNLFELANVTYESQRQYRLIMRLSQSFKHEQVQKSFDHV